MMHTIHIVGLGSSDFDQLSLKTIDYIKQFKKIYLRTEDHPAVKILKKQGYALESFDFLYDEYAEDFERVYPAIVDKLCEYAKDCEILYAVPGHPLVAEKTVQILLNSECPVHIVGGHSFLDDLFTATKVDPIDGFQLLDAFTLTSRQIIPTQHVFVAQLAHSYIASLAKLELLKCYPAEHMVQMIDAAGSANEKSEWLPLYTIDFFEGVYNLRSLYIPPLSRDESIYSFETLLSYADDIFSEKVGDVWLKGQNMNTLLNYYQEELDEYKESLAEQDIDHQIEELGDLLMQFVYQVKTAERDGLFTLEDVMAEINQKVRRRHPHVFDGVEAKTPEAVDALWQKIKKAEKEGKYETR